MKTRNKLIVLIALLSCGYADFSFAQENHNNNNRDSSRNNREDKHRDDDKDDDKDDHQGKRKPPPGFCRNVELCLEALGVPVEDLGPDFDWEVLGDNMQAIPTGNVSVGTAPSSQIKFFTSDNDDAVQIAGAFYKRSSATQSGAAVGVSGLVSDQRGNGNGVRGQASSSEPNANSVGVAALAFGDGNGHFGMSAQTFGNPSALSVGIQAIAAAATNVQYGVQAVSGLAPQETSFNAGIRSIGYGNDITPGGSNYGLHVAAYPGLETDTNIGVYTRAIRPPSNIPGNPLVNYAIYAYADCDGVDNLAGYFDGDVEITGTLCSPSDAKLKLDVETPSGSALELVQRLQPKTYTYRHDIPEFALPEGVQYGFIAQELEKVFPQFVRESTRPAITDDEGNVAIEAFHYKSASYSGLIPVLTQAIQEQQEQIEELKAENDKLQSLRSELDQMMELLSANGIVN